jgi:hypothetical protein
MWMLREGAGLSDCQARMIGNSGSFPVAMNVSQKYELGAFRSWLCFRSFALCEIPKFSSVSFFCSCTSRCFCFVSHSRHDTWWEFRDVGYVLKTYDSCLACLLVRNPQAYYRACVLFWVSLIQPNPQTLVVIDLLALSFRTGLCCFVSSIQGVRLLLYELKIARMHVTGSVHLSVLNSITSISVMKLLIVAVLFCVLHPPWFHVFPSRTQEICS